MKARTAAREIALFTLYQMGDKLVMPDMTKELFRQQLLETVRSLTSMAQEDIESSAKAISSILYDVEDYELRHPGNAKLKLHEPVRPVPLPTTGDLMSRLKTLLSGLENLNQALD